MKHHTTIPPSTPLVLLVEDEVPIAFVVQEMLTSNGIDVILARDAHRALYELVRDIGRFDVLLTDVRLGDGPDGWDLARLARDIAPTLPVIYQTGDSASRWRTEGVPASALLRKPFTEAQLISAIASQLIRTAH